MNLEPTVECNDGISNDFDALIDFPDDPGCDSATDSDESDGLELPISQCNDSGDNDGDVLADYPSDPGCRSGNDDNESDELPPPAAVFQFTAFCPIAGCSERTGVLIVDDSAIFPGNRITAKDIVSLSLDDGILPFDFPQVFTTFFDFGAIVDPSGTRLSHVAFRADGSPDMAYQFFDGSQPGPINVWRLFTCQLDCKSADNLFQVTGGNDAEWRLVGKNEAPTADAGVDQSVRVGDTVFLNGAASFDDNTPTASLRFVWNFSAMPFGSTATLIGADTATPSFVVDIEGSYEARLVVTDGFDFSSLPDDLVISSENLAPTSDAGLDQLVVVDSTVFLDGGLSTDPENDPLTYAWTLTSKPQGSTAALIGADISTPSLFVDLEGLYEATLVVSDSIGPGTPDIVVATAISPEQFAEIEIVSAGETVVGLGDAQVTTQGNQNALTNFLTQAAVAIQEGDLAEALNKLQKALLRTDGCELRGAPDANGPGRDWITECAAQSSVYDTLNSALGALTP